MSTELAALSRDQHKEIIDGMERLTKAIYIASGVVAAMVLLMAGSIFFAVTVIISK